MRGRRTVSAGPGRRKVMANRRVRPRPCLRIDRKEQGNLLQQALLEGFPGDTGFRGGEAEGLSPRNEYRPGMVPPGQADRQSRLPVFDAEFGRRDPEFCRSYGCDECRVQILGAGGWGIKKWIRQ